jgi:hypothetical protein
MKFMKILILLVKFKVIDILKCVKTLKKFSLVLLELLKKIIMEGN